MNKFIKLLNMLACVVLITAIAYIAYNIRKFDIQPAIILATDTLTDAWPWTRDEVECIGYVVQSGDTLWGICSRLYPDEITEKAVWSIRVANDLTGPSGPILQAGQQLWVPDPAEYGKN